MNSSALILKKNNCGLRICFLFKKIDLRSLNAYFLLMYHKILDFSSCLVLDKEQLKSKLINSLSRISNLKLNFCHTLSYYKHISIETK